MQNIEVLADYVTEAEFAQQIQKSQRTVQRWRQLREGPTPTIIGNRVLYSMSDVRAWLKAQRQEVHRARAS